MMNVEVLIFCSTLALQDLDPNPPRTAIKAKILFHAFMKEADVASERGQFIQEGYARRPDKVAVFKEASIGRRPDGHLSDS